MKSSKKGFLADAIGLIWNWLKPLGGLFVLITLFAGYLLLGREALPSSVGEKTTEGGWYEVYFSQPDDPGASTLLGGPDSALAQAIDEARYSVDVAVMHLDLWSLRDALLDADRRGVNIRVVVESDYILEPEIQDLIGAGIPVVEDRRESLMHHKFTVIDQLDVWSGSMNYTINGAYRNDNNLIHIRSSKLAQSYTREFEEMFIDDRFGALSETDTPYTRVNINGTEVEVYFSPDDYVLQRLLSLVATAEESIEFLAFAFTSDPLAEALIARKSDGVRVRGVIERGQINNSGSEVGQLVLAGLDLRLDTNRYKMHHKVIVIDGEIVVTGSYNFSRNAEEKNDENVLILHSDEIAQQYLLEFERIYLAASK
ncbi:MAG: phospholipase D-like domain-containing protein [Anaerolineales bacterium]|nr:phospholipase D-like domain-containing protein [Anaerolineales bacterium]